MNVKFKTLSMISLAFIILTSCDNGDIENKKSLEQDFNNQLLTQDSIANETNVKEVSMKDLSENLVFDAKLTDTDGKSFDLFIYKNDDKKNTEKNKLSVKDNFSIAIKGMEDENAYLQEHIQLWGGKYSDKQTFNKDDNLTYIIESEHEGQPDLLVIEKPSPFKSKEVQVFMVKNNLLQEIDLNIDYDNYDFYGFTNKFRNVSNNIFLTVEYKGDEKEEGDDSWVFKLWELNINNNQLNAINEKQFYKNELKHGESIQSNWESSKINEIFSSKKFSPLTVQDFPNVLKNGNIPGIPVKLNDNEESIIVKIGEPLSREKWNDKINFLYDSFIIQINPNINKVEGIIVYLEGISFDSITNTLGSQNNKGFDEKWEETFVIYQSDNFSISFRGDKEQSVANVMNLHLNK